MSQSQKPVVGQPAQAFLGPSVVKVEYHEGPIPSPQVIEGYERVLPGAADRIIKMAEKEQAHRHQIQSSHQKSLTVLTAMGQIFGF